MVELPGRGRTYIREVQGPPGAPVLLLLHGLGELLAVLARPQGTRMARFGLRDVNGAPTVLAVLSAA